MFEQIFFSPQVKLNVIISKTLVYMSFFTSCPTTSDLRSEEITEDKEILNT